MKRYWFVIGLVILAATVIGCGSSAADEDASATASPTQQVASDSQKAPGSVNDSRDRSLNFSLLSTNGGVVSFSDLRGTIPVLVFFYGGSGCDGCEERLIELQENYSRFRQLGSELVAVSTDLPEKTRSSVDRLGIEFPVLSDVDGSVSENWGVFNVTGNGHAAPAIFVFGPSGEQLAMRVAISAAELPSIDEMLQTIQRSLESGTAQSTPTPLPAKSGIPAAGDSTLISLGPGVTDFKLPDAIGGGEVALSDTLKERNVVLVFYRAFW